MCSNWFQSRDMCACMCMFSNQIHLCLSVWLSIHIPIAYRKYCIEHKRHKSLTVRNIFMSEVSFVQVFIAYDSATSSHDGLIWLLTRAEPVWSDSFDEFLHALHDHKCNFQGQCIYKQSVFCKLKHFIAQRQQPWLGLRMPRLVDHAAFASSILLKDNSTIITVKTLTRGTYCSSNRSQHTYYI